MLDERRKTEGGVGGREKKELEGMRKWEDGGCLLGKQDWERRS